MELPPPTPVTRYAAAAARRAEQVEAARRQTAARIQAAGMKMRERAWRRLDDALASHPLAPGDAVRVSMLVLPHVRRLLKSRLIGDPLPLFSTSIFTVTRARHNARLNRTLYDLEFASLKGTDPLPSVVNGCLAQLPSELRGVERRYLVRVEDGTRPTMGRRDPGLLPRTWL